MEREPHVSPRAAESAVDPLGLIPLSSSSLSFPSSFPLSFSSLLPPTPFLPSPAFPEDNTEDKRT